MSQRRVFCSTRRCLAEFHLTLHTFLQPATSGKVIVETTLGEIEVSVRYLEPTLVKRCRLSTFIIIVHQIELFAKETPKACRNFIALIMEGYYDNVIFHRIVPGFIAQTGDPTGTGMGGESVYGGQSSRVLGIQNGGDRKKC